MTGRQGEARIWCSRHHFLACRHAISINVHTFSYVSSSLNSSVCTTDSFFLALCTKSCGNMLRKRKDTNAGAIQRQNEKEAIDRGGKEGPTLRLPRWPARADGVPLHLQGTHESRRTLNSTAWGETGAKKNTRIHSGNLIRFCPSSWYFLRFLCG